MGTRISITRAHCEFGSSLDPLLVRLLPLAGLRLGRMEDFDQHEQDQLIPVHSDSRVSSAGCPAPSSGSAPNISATALMWSRLPLILA